MPKSLLALLLTIALAATFFIAVSAAGRPTSTTLPVVVDGITRTLTVVISGTGVLSATVTPISDTFKATATVWLRDLWAIAGSVEPDGRIDITNTHTALTELLDATEDKTYPAHWTPFVRQYRFAIHNCRYWLHVHSGVSANQKGAGLLAGAYFALRSACYDRYQDAYVEMERIAVDVASGRFKD